MTAGCVYNLALRLAEFLTSRGPRTFCMIAFNSGCPTVSISRSRGGRNAYIILDCLPILPRTSAVEASRDRKQLTASANFCSRTYGDISMRPEKSGGGSTFSVNALWYCVVLSVSAVGAEGARTLSVRAFRYVCEKMLVLLDWTGWKVGDGLSRSLRCGGLSANG